MSKAFRQEQILKLVAARPVRSQAQLAGALRRSGLAAAQVTLSRDLKELGLVKTAAGYRAPEAAVPASETGRSEAEAGAAAVGSEAGGRESARILRQFTRDARPARNLLVLRTEAGAAPSVARALDDEEWPELVGSLAGDDTVLLICADDARRAALERRIKKLLA